MEDLISRSAVLDLIDRYDKAPMIEENRDRIDPVKRAKAKGARMILQQLRAAAERTADLPPAEGAEYRRYGYMKVDPNYRLVPCDEDITCQACGYKRPRLRNETVFFCSRCGTCVGGLAE